MVESNIRAVVSEIRLHGVNFILLDQAVPEIFYFKHDIGDSIIIIFIGNPDVDNFGDAILVPS